MRDPRFRLIQVNKGRARFMSDCAEGTQMENSIEIAEQKTSNSATFISAYINSDGSLRLMGQDLG